MADEPFDILHKEHTLLLDKYNHLACSLINFEQRIKALRELVKAFNIENCSPESHEYGYDIKLLDEIKDTIIDILIRASNKKYIEDI